MFNRDSENSRKPMEFFNYTELLANTRVDHSRQVSIPVDECKGTKGKNIAYCINQKIAHHPDIKKNVQVSYNKKEKVIKVGFNKEMSDLEVVASYESIKKIMIESRYTKGKKASSPKIIIERKYPQGKIPSFNINEPTPVNKKATQNKLVFVECTGNADEMRDLKRQRMTQNALTVELYSHHLDLLQSTSTSLSINDYVPQTHNNNEVPSSEMSSTISLERSVTENVTTIEPFMMTDQVINQPMATYPLFASNVTLFNPPPSGVFKSSLDKIIRPASNIAKR